MKKFLKIFLLVAIITFSIINLVTFAKTNLSYKEWYYQQFGEYPSGSISDWRYDPVYSAYLVEIGETGYNNDVNGEKKPPYPPYDERYYPTIEDTYWQGLTARWDVEGYATKYQVVLYRNGSRVTSKTVQTRSHSFASHMVRGEYEYFFRVRAYNKETGWWSDWVESDTQIRTNRTEEERGGGPGITPAVNPIAPLAPAYPAGTWEARNGKWYYKFTNGTYPSNTWLQIAGKWYYFNPDSTMATGWLNINGQTFYLNPDGSMLTGTVIFDGITHFFNENGVMIY